MRKHAISPALRSGRSTVALLAGAVTAAMLLASPVGAQDSPPANGWEQDAAPQASGPPPDMPQQDPAQNRQEAIDILKAMAEYVGGQSNIKLGFDSELEVVTPELEKLQFTSSGQAWISRPDQFRVTRTGGYADVELISDGRSVTVFDKDRNVFARDETGGTIDAVLDKLRGDLMLDLPAADLLIGDSFNVLMADVVDAKHIGRGVIGGIDCEHVAFRNRDTDWQLWVEVGEQPIPCKMVITSKAVAAAPQYTIQFTEWQNGDEFPPGTFSFNPPADARQVNFNSLTDIDEIPAGLEPGAQK